MRNAGHGGKDGGAYCTEVRKKRQSGFKEKTMVQKSTKIGGRMLRKIVGRFLEKTASGF